MPLGLCVVGCGQFARTFVKAVRSFGGLAPPDQIELFFASRDRKKARAYCRMFDGKDFFGSYEEAASDPRVHALYLCTPHHLHMEHTLLAAQFSKHILVEKPIARTLEEGERMVAAARDAGVKLMVAENIGFMSTVRKSRELIEAGAVGEVRFIQIQEEANYVVQGWRAGREMMGGGVLIDGGIHSVNILIELGGMPEEVYASTLPKTLHDLEGEDGLVLMARLPGGGAGLINHAWGISRSAWRLWAAISGTRGRIYFERRRPMMTLETDQGKSIFRFTEDRDGIGNMVREFRDSIVEDRTPLTSGEVGLRDLKLILRAYESAERRASVLVT